MHSLLRFISEMTKISQIYNWSRYPVIGAQLHTFRTHEELKQLLATVPKLITRGSGLSYGDASLANHILSTSHFNKMLEFDEEAGIIRCESGVTLDELLKVIVPAGWFLPVTPGTKFITMGGAVAADVHGKNHHKEGSIGRYVTELSLMLANGDVVTCNRHENSELFHATCGGMGLTGVILEVELRLKKVETSAIYQKNLIARNLTELIQLLRENNDWTYSVAWIDCLSTGKNMGRGVLMLGEHARLIDLPQHERYEPYKVHTDPKLKVPFAAPSFVLNRFSIGAFNYLFNLKHMVGKKEFVVDYDKFFYPLDFVKGWNHLYGKRGFLQYQFVIPFENGEKALAEILNRICQSKLASFLSVLKLLGESDNSIAFPMPGFTLSLDLPVSARLFPLLEELDTIVAANNGRLYLAKDARMNSQTFEKGYPGVKQFKDLLQTSGANAKFESALSKRLSIST